VAFKPEDSRVVSIVGRGIFGMYKLTEGVLKPQGPPKPNIPDCTCHAWLSTDMVVVGTDAGTIIVYEAFEAKKEYHLQTEERDIRDTIV